MGAGRPAMPAWPTGQIFFFCSRGTARRTPPESFYGTLLPAVAELVHYHFHSSAVCYVVQTLQGFRVHVRGMCAKTLTPTKLEGAIRQKLGSILSAEELKEVMGTVPTLKTKASVSQVFLAALRALVSEWLMVKPEGSQICEETFAFLLSGQAVSVPNATWLFLSVIEVLIYLFYVCVYGCLYPTLCMRAIFYSCILLVYACTCVCTCLCFIMCVPHFVFMCIDLFMYSSG